MSSSQNLDFAALRGSVAHVALLARELSSGLTRPADKLEQADQVVSQVRTLVERVNKISRVIKALRATCQALVVVPVLGELTELLATALSLVDNLFSPVNRALSVLNTGALRALSEALGQLRSGVRTIRSTVSRIVTGGQTFDTSLRVVGAIYTVARPLAIKGGGPLTPLVSALATAGEVLGAAVGPVGTALDEAITHKNDLDQAIDSIAALGSEKLTQAADAVAEVFHALEPIHDGFEAVLSAIKPLGWVLDASSWLAEKILQPVIDSILDFFGLKEKLKSIGMTIMGGLRPALLLLEEFYDTVKPEVIEKLKDWFGDAAAAALAADWGRVADALASYQPQKDGDFREVLLRVLQAVVEQTSGPMPAWPARPGSRGGGAS